MTAEIAILNKTAVALAADSAVTISAGSSQEKIYDTADKLFELSSDHPIGVMINNDMNFMEAPLPVLIKEYRNERRCFPRVEEAAFDFLKFLHSFGASAPQKIKSEQLRRIITPVVNTLERRIQEGLVGRLFVEGQKPRDFNEVAREVFQEQIAVIRNVFERSPTASLIGGKIIRPGKRDRAVIDELVNEKLQMATADERAAISNILRTHLDRVGFTAMSTGVVVAGFGAGELFPTLVAYRLEGMVCDRLRFRRDHLIDIDRTGDRARVLPFAQREMVERFLYGLDASIERQISQFCKNSVPKIRDKILDCLEMSDEDRDALLKKAQEAERGFFDGLAEESFAAIRQTSRTAIEDMVEFMPKPEMAKMAEALVNLTSIKRRVSRGMETVGGPIDVAVISKSEGFVWVKRKHYFPEELNYRFFDRMRAGNGRRGSERNGENLQLGNIGA